MMERQDETIEYVASTIHRLMQDGKERIYIISTYGIGKERILLEVHFSEAQQAFS